MDKSPNSIDATNLAVNNKLVPSQMTTERLIELLRYPNCLCTEENRLMLIAEGIARLLEHLKRGGA